MLRNNPNVDMVNINAYLKFGENHQFVLKILGRNENLTNSLKITGNNPFNINAHTNFGQILSIHSQDIERKQNTDISLMSQGP